MNNKFGVPTDTTGDDRAPTIQPKFKNRFRVFFYNFGNPRQSLSGVGNKGVIQTDQERLALMGNVVSFKKPNVTFTEVGLSSFLGKGKTYGRPTWENLNITLRDDIKNAAMRFIMRQIHLQQQKYMPHSTSFGRNFSFDIMLEVMDGRVGHTGIERWFFTGCSILQHDFGDHSYESTTDFQKLSLTIGFNNVYIFSPARINLASAHQYNERGGRALTVSELSSLNDLGVTIMDEVYGVINRATDSLVDTVGDVIDNTGNLINQTLGNQFDYLGDLTNQVGTNISNAIETGTDYASGLFNGRPPRNDPPSNGGFINEIDFGR